MYYNTGHTTGASIKLAGTPRQVPACFNHAPSMQVKETWYAGKLKENWFDLVSASLFQSCSIHDECHMRRRIHVI
jgi:hypothetical protein